MSLSVEAVNEMAKRPRRVENLERRAIAFLYSLIDLYPKHAVDYMRRKNLVDNREKVTTLSG
jgi:hypothetical protein